MKRTRAIVAAALMMVMAVTLTAPAMASTTAVPGHQGRDGVVVGHYTSVYAYDANGDNYWDLGDGRVQGTVDSVDDLDDETLTTCDYQIVYRGDFGDEEFLDEGWTINNIVCKGYGVQGAETVHYRSNWGGDYPQFD